MHSNNVYLKQMDGEDVECSVCGYWLGPYTYDEHLLIQYVVARPNKRTVRTDGRTEE